MPFRQLVAQNLLKVTKSPSGRRMPLIIAHVRAPLKPYPFTLPHSRYVTPSSLTLSHSHSFPALPAATTTELHALLLPPSPSDPLLRSPHPPWMAMGTGIYSISRSLLLSSIPAAMLCPSSPTPVTSASSLQRHPTLLAPQLGAAWKGWI